MECGYDGEIEIVQDENDKLFDGNVLTVVIQTRIE